MTETRTEDPTPDALAGAVRDAPFVRIVATDDGDALAAAGLLARALRARDTPFQVRVSPDPVPDSAPDADDDAVPVTIGADRSRHAIPGRDRPASTTAFAVARELDADPDPVLALAGTVAAGSVPGTDGSGDALEIAERAGLLERRPGVAVPTAELADGLAASTLLRTAYSGDQEAAEAAVAELGVPADPDADTHRRLASLVAVDVATAEGASDRAATAIERALHPYAIDATDASFHTVGGYADVLEALAREAPGTGVALALATELDDSLRTSALDVWYDHGIAAHEAVSGATMGRYDGCVVARVAADPAVLPTVARIVRNFRSPEPVAIALSETEPALAAAATEPVGLGDACRAAATETGGDGHGSPTRGAVRAPAGTDPAELTAAVREAL